MILPVEIKLTILGLAFANQSLLISDFLGFLTSASGDGAGVKVE